MAQFYHVSSRFHVLYSSLPSKILGESVFRNRPYLPDRGHVDERAAARLS